MTSMHLSPRQRAWLRLRANRAAVAGLMVISAVALAGAAAPWIAKHVLHLSPEEQHTALRFAGPGVADTSRDHPGYDGDKAAFARLDADGDGQIRCTLRPAQGVTQSIAKRAFETASGEQLPADHRLPAARLAAVFAGDLVCPELDRWTVLGRVYDLLLQLHDVDHDGGLSLAEWPDAADLDPRLGKSTLAAARAHNLFGNSQWSRFDRDRNGVVSTGELLSASRICRFSAAHLLNHYDRDGDLSISADEFPGLPAMRTFWLGTDGKGRDLLVRLLFGARVSLLVGLLATAVALLLGVTWGAIAGYVGGRVDHVMMRIVDALYGLPFMFIVILLLVVAGRSTINLFIALGAVSWLSMARIVRGQVLSIRERDYVLAARALGASPARIVLRHVLPGTVGPVVVYATLMVPAVILEEALLSFLGLGVQPPDASWGTLIAEGAGLMAGQPWLIIFPAITLAATLLSLNFIGDGLRDALDPGS